MMERLVRDPLRATGHIGTLGAVVMLTAVFGFGAPRWIFIPICFVALMLVLHIGARAEREKQHESD
jgi:uncharacterized membrane protein